ncbi:MAG: hypothetical protein Pg6C_06370 [Treponemataceae bacterium]|nr:MAG: hypothetical protein Pg6C_06370 [Treponemataceae bacterium]
MTTRWRLINTSEDILVDEDTIVTKSGRIFHSAHKELLDSLPPDMARELARRRLEDIKRIKEKKTSGVRT